MSSETDAIPAVHKELAAQWYWVIRDSEATDQDIADWQAWMNASSVNRRAFERIETTLSIVDGVDSPSWPTTEQLVHDQYDGTMPIGEWRSRSAAKVSDDDGSRTPRLHTGRRWALAATILLAVAIGIVLFGRPWDDAVVPPDYVLYRTLPAEHKVVELPDGSSVTLGGKSTVSVAYNSSQRNIVLKQGEVYFQVAKDKNRPFIVEANGREITAVGTAFNVSRQDARVVVTVTEGTVIVAADTVPTTRSLDAMQRPAHAVGNIARLEAGHKIVYDDNDVKPISTTNSDDAIAWRDGLLKYSGEPLRFVVDDVSRYVNYPIVLADPAAGEILFTGTVFQNDADNWVFGLEDAFPLVVSDTADGVIVRMKTVVAQ